MKRSLPQGVADAARLTRNGDLTGATALIQSLLSGAAHPLPAPPVPGETIDGKFTRLEEPSAPAARQPLSETLRRISAGGMPAKATRTARARPRPAGASFTWHSHHGAEGQRDYMLYRPAGADQSHDPMPLVVMLHGCTQSPEDFANGTGMNALADRSGMMIAYPAQPQAANIQKCWNWFNPGDQGRDRGEPALIAGLTRAVLTDHRADASRVYVAGLSAGGAAATLVARAYPDLFAAAGVHSGLPAGAASDVASAFAAMRNGAAGSAPVQAMPTIIFHGDADSTVHPANGDALACQALAGFPTLAAIETTGTTVGGRKYRRTCHSTSDGRSMVEHWSVSGGSHAWSGGHPSGSYTDPAGPDASQEMLRFFLQHSTKAPA